MIIGAVGLLFDVWGIQDVIIRFREFATTGEYPQQDLGNMMLGELAKWIVLGVVSVILLIWGYASSKS